MPQASERWERVKEIFAAAMDLAPNERATLLRKQCGDDDSLRAEIESLLESDDKAASFIEQPAGEIPRDLFPRASDDSLTGQQFGAYQVIREIGRGGLGTVYLAARSDDEYRKEVALKLVRRGLDTEDILRRFRNERQILAQLDHPNIARLIDGGTTADGLPYFVMEYVKGEPIGAYCAAHALAVPARLNLFRKVCAAVSYAHQNLVIHRDLKPSNILVATDAEPKLLDFGIAKLVSPGDELFTQTIPALRVMTPEYASPEQVKGAVITTASDIYSLGVLLYELLTGQRPYRLKTRTAEEIAGAITDQEPERPSTAIARGDGNPKNQNPNPKLLRGDLDNIALMALRKEPQRRYATVEQFSEDIRRHLEGRPVIAHKDTLTYRATKFVKRQKLGVAAALLILGTLIAAVILTSREQRRAERRFNDVRQLSNALLFEIAPRIERLEGSTEAREALVRRALEYLDSLGEESGNDPQLQSELAAAYEKVGEIQGAPRKPNLSDFAGAILSYGKARKIRQELLAKNPNDFGQRQRLAANLAAASFIREWTSDVTGSLEDSKKSLEIYEKLITERPDSIEVQIATAEAQLDLALTYYFNDQLAEVYPPLRKALASLEKLRETNPEHSEVLRLLGRGYGDLGMTLFWDGKPKEGEREMEKAFGINKLLLAQHPRDNVVQQACLYTFLQASQLYEESNSPRAFEILLEALNIAEGAVRSDAANIQARQNLAKTYSMLGVIALHLTKFDDAILHLEKSFAAFAELEKIDPKNRTYKHDIGRVLMFLGQAKHKKTNFPDALADYEKAVALFADDAKADPKNFFPLRKLATVHNYIGETHEESARTNPGPQSETHLQAARENYRRALDFLATLKAQNALTEKDREFVENLQAAVRRCGG